MRRMTGCCRRARWVPRVGLLSYTHIVQHTAQHPPALLTTSSLRAMTGAVVSGKQRALHATAAAPGMIRVALESPPLLAWSASLIPT